MTPDERDVITQQQRALQDALIAKERELEDAYRAYTITLRDIARGKEDGIEKDWDAVKKQAQQDLEAAIARAKGETE